MTNPRAAPVASSRRQLSIGVTVVFIAYLLGAYSGRYDAFPFPLLRAIGSTFTTKQPTRFTFDKLDILVSDDQKRPTSCPRQTDRTAVLLVMGQSNAANHGGQRFRSKHGDEVINFFGGKCFVAASPLLGADGITGEYWSELGNLLLDRGAVDRVILAPVAVSGSKVSRWTPSGDIHPRVVETVRELTTTGYRVTRTLWTQGEIDYVVGTGEEAYRDRFLQLVDSLRSEGVASPVYVSVTSKCLGESNGGTQTHLADNPVTRAQRSLPNAAPGIRAGVNTDELLGDDDRHDDCHFAATGEEKVARAWADLLAGDP
ncbi:sialate O-acetylesterase [Aureimonas leprariae]|uniref:Sialate O-acetylesterase n=1 Tax=Plantimonas leprariae TaxID=2615207 RepID=A0A7V7PQG5_9HYPH|nr:sialate O-acetylesterase [Aureimonas leprariae]KAB0680372.1 sialate O-acetylesterase [Aureimonas leprariae]